MKKLLNIFFYSKFLYKIKFKLYRLTLRLLNTGDADFYVNGEQWLLKNIKILLKRNDDITIFDVGLNVGDYTNMALNLYPNARIYGFEPNKKLYDFCIQRFTNNTNVVIEHFGCSSKSQEAILYGAGETTASVYKRELKHFANTINNQKQEKCTFIKLSSYIKSKKISKLDFLTIDVEGHDFDVLCGLENEIKKVKIIQFEIGGANIDSKVFFQNIYYFFKENDFKIFWLFSNGLVEIKTYTEDLEIFKYHNMVAINKQIMAEL